MSEPECTCPEPGFCERYQTDQGPLAHGYCRGTACSLARSQRFRDKLRARLTGEKGTLRPITPRVKRVPLTLKPVCRWQGAEVPGCKTCGGEASIVRWCESPDDDADRCVRGPSRDPSIRSCLDCPHYSGASSNDATTGTPETSR